MKKILCLIEVVMLGLIILINFISVKENDVISIDLNIKQVKSCIFNKRDKKILEDTSLVDNEEELVLDKVVEVLGNDLDYSTIIEDDDFDTIVVDNTNDILEVQTGGLSGYGPDCVGCSGYLASGIYAGDGNIYYNDPFYGVVRIVAGDKKYPFGSIVKIKSNLIDSDILAIVLDRGGVVGLDGKYMFDLLFQTEKDAYSFGSFQNTTFEILRYGY